MSIYQCCSTGLYTGSIIFSIYINNLPETQNEQMYYCLADYHKVVSTDQTASLRMVEKFKERLRSGYAFQTCKDWLRRWILLPLSLYFEMNVILLITSISRGNYKNYISDFQLNPINTRHGDRKDKVTRP